jgi:hypothetical protein
MYLGLLVPGVVTMPIGFSSPAAIAACYESRIPRPSGREWVDHSVGLIGFGRHARSSLRPFGAVGEREILTLLWGRSVALDKLRLSL